MVDAHVARQACEVADVVDLYRCVRMLSDRQAMECEIGAEAKLGADVVAGVDARVAADGGEGPGSVLPAA